jgi:hypothetical protein
MIIYKEEINKNTICAEAYVCSSLCSISILVTDGDLLMVIKNDGCYSDLLQMPLRTP